MLNSCVSMRKATERLLLWKKAYWQGGVGSAILEELNENKLLEHCEVRCFGIPDEFVMHGDKKLLFRDFGTGYANHCCQGCSICKG